MFILSYFRKKQTIKVKEDTLENLDDFIVISDNLNNTSIEEDKEENVKNIDIVDQLKINNNSIEYVNKVNHDTSFSAPYHKGDEENDEVNYDTSFSASGLCDRRELEVSKRLPWRDEENQLIENTKDNHRKLSFCDKIMKDLVTFIFGEDVIIKNKLAQQN